MPKTKKITIRIQEDEYYKIKANADAANTSLNRYLIETALGAQESDRHLRSTLAGHLCKLQNLLLTEQDYVHLHNAVVTWRAEAVDLMGW